MANKVYGHYKYMHVESGFNKLNLWIEQPFLKIDFLEKYFQMVGKSKM